jgi:general stress protein 26
MSHIPSFGTGPTTSTTMQQQQQQHQHPFSGSTQSTLPAATENDKKRLCELIKEVDTCMMTTIGADGKLHSRPMCHKQVECAGGDYLIWFFTKGESLKVKESQQHGCEVNLNFVAPNAYVSICGDVQVIRDKFELQRRWDENLKTWFPHGLNEPDLALLKVLVRSAEYWDIPSTGKEISHGFQVMLEKLGGQPAPKLEIQHKAVQLEPTSTSSTTGMPLAQSKQRMDIDEAKMEDIRK